MMVRRSRKEVDVTPRVLDETYSDLCSYIKAAGSEAAGVKKWNLPMVIQ